MTDRLIISMQHTMPPRIEDDWSDSEDGESVSELETSVLLGIPDGEIQDPLDLSDPSVSRIGGVPVCHIVFSPQVVAVDVLAGVPSNPSIVPV